jgi:chemotaxis protein MotB
VPINTREFPSNWELSAARALSVVKFLFTHGGIDPARLSAVGYGEYRPIAPNDTEINRQKNRRIEIYVEYLTKEEK